MKTTRILISMMMCILPSVFLSGQEHYRFNCKDYVSTDNSRAPQSSFTYDTDANTFSILASGANNVAFKMNEGLDGEYYIDQDETLLLICGKNLSQTKSNSYVWWLNGFNNGGQVMPDQVEKDGDATVLLWNLKTNSAINRNFNFSESKIPIGSHGASFILAVGLTAQNSGLPGVISDFGYYAPCEVAAKHPSLMAKFGYDAAGLTAAVNAKTLKVNPGMKDEVSQVGSDDYLQAYTLLLKARDNSEEEDATNHTASYERTANGVKACFDDLYVNILFHNDSVLHVVKSYDDGPFKKSWSVITSPDDDVTFSLDEADGVLMMQTDKLRVEYTLQKGNVIVKDRSGEVIVRETKHRFSPTNDGSFDSFTVSQYFRLADDERIYGMGQLQDGQLNRRGTVVRLEQDNRSICIPYFLSSKHYGLYWDNYSPTTFNDSGANTFFRSTGRAVDYYVLTGNDSHEIQRSLRRLTGDCQLPPLWNFGLYQSKERYKSADEVMSVVRKYRSLKIPFDCLVQDWQYWGDDYHWNAMEFLNPDYSNYQQMIDFIHQNHAKIMISIWASFGPQTKPFKELKDKGLLFTSETWPSGKGVKPYNPYSPEARDIYWRYLYDGIVSKGIDAYWMDSTEPDFFGTESDKDNVALTGQTWRSLRNAFPLATVEGVAQHHQSIPALKDKRVSIMTRSGYLGMQRTGAFVWSADITSGWETLANQIPAACNLSESGLPYWNSDTGGFFTGKFGGVGDPAWRRLYLRWTQFSTFTPMLRFHGTDTPREPWQFGQAGDERGEFDNLLRYIKLRYSLLPYIYSTAHQVRTDAQGFMNAMPVAFPGDSNTFDVKDQYMFGQSILVAPVLEDGVNGRNVYLPQFPEGKWIDFWNGYSYPGGTRQFKVAPMNVIPLYVRSGSILPWGPEVQYATEKKWDDLEIRVYPGSDGLFELYEDEFDNMNYKDGKYSLIPISWNESSKTLTFGNRIGEYDGMLKERTFNIVVVSPEKGTGPLLSTGYDAVVKYDGNEVSVNLEARNVAEPVAEECTEKIVNPSFEADGRSLTKIAPKGWSVDSPTAWWGVNEVAENATGDPQPTDGRFLFGVWDGTVMNASVFQAISPLQPGQYRLTVDMHASNREGVNRVGNQCLFANDKKVYFKNQITTAGVGDAYPMQTIGVVFNVEDGNAPVTIGVSTGDAPAETWFKIDNFRLYRLSSDEAVGVHTLTPVQGSIDDAYYTLDGLRVTRPVKGIYIHDGKKILF